MNFNSKQNNSLNLREYQQEKVIFGEEEEFMRRMN